MKKAFCASIGIALFLYGGDIDELQGILDEATEIATISKMNVDYVPSVVTVMKSDKLRTLGVKNVSEALQLLPGVQMYVNQLGETVSVFRGFRNPNAYLSDKIKVMIDGMPVNTESYGSASFVMDMPIDIVERIEVLRGAGSTIYGSGAFYGAVNIVTKSVSKSSNCTEAFVAGGSWWYKKVGAIGCTEAKNGFLYSADGYYQGHKRKLQVDSSYVDSPADFHRDYTTSEQFEDYSVGFSLKKDNLSWTTRLKKNWQGNYYSMEERLDTREDSGHVNQILTSELNYKLNTDSGSVNIKTGIRDYAYQMNGMARDVGYVQGNGLATFNDDFRYRVRFAETAVYTEAVHKFKKYKDNEVSIGAGVSYAKVRENYFASNVEDYVFDNNIAVPHQAMNYPQNHQLLKDNLARTVGSLYFEDVYALNAAIDLVAGARIDKYSDLDLQFNSRLGAVARLSDSLIAKLMYSTGHRAPTLLEKYARAHIGFRAGDDFLKSEEIKSYETMLIYKPSEKHNFSVNLYYSELNNVIDIEEIAATDAGHANYPKRLSKGVEIEYTLKPSDKHEIHANATINKTTYLSVSDGETKQDMPDVSPRMYKMWYVYKPSSELSFALKHIMLDKTTQNATSGKDTTVPANQTTDININWKFAKDTDISFAVYNIQNREQKMPSYYYRNEPSRNGGMIREGRNAMLELRRNF